jgi:hypothetical protein
MLICFIWVLSGYEDMVFSLFVPYLRMVTVYSTLMRDKFRTTYV